MKEKIMNTKLYPVLKKLKLKLVAGREYRYDKKIFKKNYVYSKPNTINKLSYDMIRTVHSIEKGVSNENPRPFGIYPTNTLMDSIKKYEKLTKDKNFSYNLALTSLDTYLKFYEEKNWTEEKQYQIVKEFMMNRNKFEKIEAGSILYDIDTLNKGKDYNYKEFLKNRRSVRKFSKTKISEADLKEVLEMAILTPSACNRQMIKAYDIRNKDNKKEIEKMAQGLGGFELENANYMIVTFDINSLYFIGERNQGWFNSGLFSMNLVNAMHSKGIGSCFVQFGNSSTEEEKLKKELNIPNNERIAVILVYGYYEDNTKVPDSSRKKIEDIYRER